VLTWQYPIYISKKDGKKDETKRKRKVRTCAVGKDITKPSIDKPSIDMVRKISNSNSIPT